MPHTVDLTYIFCSAVKTRLFAHDRRTGDILWERKLSDGSMCTALVIAGTRVFAGTNGYIYGFELSTGELLWDNSMSGHGMGITTLAVAQGSSTLTALLFVAFNEKVFALERNDGRVIWAHALEKGSQATAIHVDGDTLVAASNGHIYGLEARSGERLWFNAMRGKGYGITTLASIMGSTQDDAARTADYVVRSSNG